MRVKARRSVVAVGAGPRHLRTREEARDGSFADLGVDLAVVLVLDPGLGRLVEGRKREVGHVLQHGDQPALDRAPERLLLGILVRAVGQRGLVQDAEPGETLGDLGGRHGCAIVAQAGTRQAALLERLRQAMGDVLGASRPDTTADDRQAGSDHRARRTGSGSATRRAR